VFGITFFELLHVGDTLGDVIITNNFGGPFCQSCNSRNTATLVSHISDKNPNGLDKGPHTESETECGWYLKLRFCDDNRQDKRAVRESTLYA